MSVFAQGQHFGGKQPLAVLSQKLVHRTLRNQLPAQFHSVQKPTITTFTTLHTTTIIPTNPKREPTNTQQDRLISSLLANRLVGILHGCLKHRTPYDEHTAWAHRTIPDKAAA